MTADSSPLDNHGPSLLDLQFVSGTFREARRLARNIAFRVELVLMVLLLWHRRHYSRCWSSRFKPDDNILPVCAHGGIEGGQRTWDILPDPCCS